MELRDFLIRAHICSQYYGGSVKNVAYFMNEIQKLPTEEEFIKLLKLSEKKIGKYMAYFLSDGLTKEVEENKNYGGICTIFDEDYPVLLKEIYNPPLVFFYNGNFSLLNAPTLAIVGARKHSPYAKEVLKKLLPDVLDEGIATVSGLAKGIDSLAHKITLSEKGKTIGVIGTGLDRTYPRENFELQANMEKEGIVLSEYALGQKPLRFHFPARNRIISGLCQSLLVVEARRQSGSLITANMALQENRNILAVPGNINSILSEGCNELILEGAKPILRAEDILEEFKI